MPGQTLVMARIWASHVISPALFISKSSSSVFINLNSSNSESKESKFSATSEPCLLFALMWSSQLSKRRLIPLGELIE